MPAIQALLDELIKSQGSDLHLSAGSVPFVRVHGDLIPLPGYKVLSNTEVQGLVMEILNDRQKKKFIETWELDFSYELENGERFRGNIFMQKRGLAAVFRHIQQKVKTAQELGLPQEVLDLLDCDRGLILVTGPTGSGKTTTLAAMIHFLNENFPYHIITIEDPIEYVHKNMKSLINQREVDSHTKSFDLALKSALREDPDVIFIGELRTLETISLALTAAETGHIVLATLHTNNTAGTVNRLIDVFPADQQQQIRVQLAESLRGVIAQTLFKRIDKPGRIAAFEILRNNKAIANLIREGKIHQIASILQTHRKEGMFTFEKYISGLLAKGIVSKDEVMAFLGAMDVKLAS